MRNFFESNLVFFNQSYPFLPPLIKEHSQGVAVEVDESDYNITIGTELRIDSLFERLYIPEFLSYDPRACRLARVSNETLRAGYSQFTDSIMDKHDSSVLEFSPALHKSDSRNNPYQIRDVALIVHSPASFPQACRKWRI